MKLEEILNWIPLNDEIEVQHFLYSGLVMQNCSCGSGCFGSRSVNVQFDINLATSVTAEKGRRLVCKHVSFCHIKRYN